MSMFVITEPVPQENRSSASPVVQPHAAVRASWYVAAKTVFDFVLALGLLVRFANVQIDLPSTSSSAAFWSESGPSAALALATLDGSPRVASKSMPIAPPTLLAAITGTSPISGFAAASAGPNRPISGAKTAPGPSVRRMPRSFK